MEMKYLAGNTIALITTGLVRLYKQAIQVFCSLDIAIA